MSATTAIVAASVGTVAANTARQQKAACDSLMDGYTHSGAALAEQQAYAACVPPAATEAGHLEAQVIVAALLLALPIGLAVALVRARKKSPVDEVLIFGILAVFGWGLIVAVLVSVFYGIRFVFS